MITVEMVPLGKLIAAVLCDVSIFFFCPTHCTGLSNPYEAVRSKPTPAGGESDTEPTDPRKACSPTENDTSSPQTNGHRMREPVYIIFAIENILVLSGGAGVPEQDEYREIEKP